MRLAEWYDSIAHEADIDCIACGAWYATKYGPCGEWGFRVDEEAGEKHWFHWCGNQWHPCKPRVKLTRANGEVIYVQVSDQIKEESCETPKESPKRKRSRRSAS